MKTTELFFSFTVRCGLIDLERYNHLNSVGLCCFFWQFRPFFRFPSQEEPFKSVINNVTWREDRVFTEQRLAGLNPMSLMKVTTGQGEWGSKTVSDLIQFPCEAFRDKLHNSSLWLSFFIDSVGVKWSYLKPRLNQNYSWDAAVTRSVGKNMLLEEAIADGSIFVAQYPVFDNLVTVPDITDPRPTRKMWSAMSPIALFASGPGENGAPAHLRPVAIQLDYTPGKM